MSAVIRLSVINEYLEPDLENKQWWPIQDADECADYAILNL